VQQHVMLHRLVIHSNIFDYTNGITESINLYLVGVVLDIHLPFLVQSSTAISETGSCRLDHIAIILYFCMISMLLVTSDWLQQQVELVAAGSISRYMADFQRSHLLYDFNSYKSSRYIVLRAVLNNGNIGAPGRGAPPD